MHEGIGKNGVHLYPAFPYQWYTKISREDVAALKAYLDTITPVNQPSRRTHLTFPLDVRSGIAAWNAAYFKIGEFKPDPSQSNEFNRGAYLVEGLGHCGDCHTPKGFAMEPLESKAFSGGKIDNWYAPNITADRVHGVGGWSDDALAHYLKTGLAPGKAALIGPMAQVVHESLSYLTDSDIHAIVTFLKNTVPVADYKPERSASLTGPHAPGESVYLNNCASCHQLDGKGRPGAIPALDGSDVVRAKGPENVVRVVLGGLLAHGTYAPMPAVGAGMSDQEVADVVTYVRNAWTNAAPGTTGAGTVAAIRAKTSGIMALRSDPDAKTDPCRLDSDALPVKSIPDPKNKIEATLVSLQPIRMGETIDRLISRARAAAPKDSQAEIINGLTQAYCYWAVKSGAINKPDAARLIGQFSVRVFTELNSHGKD
jgi:mono/diheme cytochrome c family protein